MHGALFDTCIADSYEFALHLPYALINWAPSIKNSKLADSLLLLFFVFLIVSCLRIITILAGSSVTSSMRSSRSWLHGAELVHQLLSSEECEILILLRVTVL